MVATMRSHALPVVTVCHKDKRGPPEVKRRVALSQETRAILRIAWRWYCCTSLKPIGRTRRHIETTARNSKPCNNCGSTPASSKSPTKTKNPTYLQGWHTRRNNSRYPLRSNTTSPPPANRPPQEKRSPQLRVGRRGEAKIALPTSTRRESLIALAPSDTGNCPRRQKHACMPEGAAGRAGGGRRAAAGGAGSERQQAARAGRKSSQRTHRSAPPVAQKNGPAACQPCCAESTQQRRAPRQPCRAESAQQRRTPPDATSPHPSCRRYAWAAGPPPSLQGTLDPMPLPAAGVRATALRFSAVAATSSPGCSPHCSILKRTARPSTPVTLFPM